MTEQNWQDLQVIWDYMKVESAMPEMAGAIVVGGTGSRTDMAERAVELYREGRAPVIVFSGFRHPNFAVNEAEMLARYAIDNGIPRDVVLVETEARNTGLNVLLSAELIRKKLGECNKVILAHRPFMTRRFLATAQKQWPEPQPEFFVTSLDISLRDYYERDERAGLGDKMIREMLGDYERVTEYAKRGFQVPQPESPDAEEALERLKTDGFVAKKEGNPDFSTENFSKNDSLEK